MNVIYAAIQGSEIVYVGTTRVPLRRRINIHARQWPLTNLVLSESIEFYIIRTVDCGRAKQLERQIIMALKRRGQCKLNMSTRLPKNRSIEGRSNRYVGSFAVGNMRLGSPCARIKALPDNVTYYQKERSL